MLTHLIVLPVFMLYSLSGFVASVFCLLRPLPPIPDSPDGCTVAGLQAMRPCAILGLFLLAFGTGCDNARTFAGAFATNVPDRVFDLKNSTDAQRLIDERGGVIDANYLISWFCFAAHEVLGGMFVLPGVYLWAVASTPPVPERVSAWRMWHSRLLPPIGFVVAALAVCIGVVTFAQHTATSRLQLTWNDALGLWSWTSGNENPFGLLGVFLSSGVWVVVGVLLLVHSRTKWFLVVQLISLVGQGLAGGLGGDLVELPSNFFEQLVTWSLVILGWQLSGEDIDVWEPSTWTGLSNAGNRHRPLAGVGQALLSGGGSMTIGS